MDQFGAGCQESWNTQKSRSHSRGENIGASTRNSKESRSLHLSTFPIQSTSSLSLGRRILNNANLEDRYVGELYLLSGIMNELTIHQVG